MPTLLPSTVSPVPYSRLFDLINSELLTAILLIKQLLGAGVRFPVRTKDFTLLKSIQTGSGAHAAPY
jgi:hypothetical protein